MHLDDLEEYFKNVELPKEFQLYPYMKILNCRNFVDSHIFSLRNNSGNKKYLPYYERLLAFRNELEKQKNPKQ